MSGSPAERRPPSCRCRPDCCSQIGVLSGCFDPPARACPTGRTASDGTWEGRATVCTLAGSIRVQAAQLLVLASDEPEKARRGKTDALLP